MKLKRILSAVILLTLAIGATAEDSRFKLIENSPSRISFSVNFHDLRLSEEIVGGVAYDRFNLAEGGEFADAAGSSLPVITRFVAVAPGAKLAVAEAAGESRLLSTGRRPVEDLGHPAEAEQLNRAAFEQNFVFIGRAATMRGVRLVPVTIRPVIYLPGSMEYRVATEITVELDIASNGAAPSVEGRFAEIAEGAGILNVRRDLPGGETPFERYLVIAREECLPYAIPLLEWKRQAGYEIKVLTYPEDDLDVIGESDVEAVRDEIRDLYEDDLSRRIEPFDYIWIIGDREDNLGGAPWVFPSFVGIPTMEQTAPHADFLFGQMDRDTTDYLMDVAVGRLTAGNQDRLELAVARQLAYEKSPSMQDSGWFTRAGVFSQRWGDNFETSLLLNVRWGESLLERIGFDSLIVFETSGAGDAEEAAALERALIEMLNRGSSVMIGRAQNNQWDRQLPGEVSENSVFPYGINFCGHGEFSAESMFNTGSANELKGPVLWTTGWGQPLTQYSNVTWASVIKGIFVSDLPAGWARAMIGLTLPRVFPHEEVRYFEYQTDFDLYGDPGLKPWIGVPRRVTLQHPPVAAGMTFLGLRVMDAEGRNPVEGARVTIYQPGDLPDPADYAEWTPNLNLTGVTNSEGRVRFTIPEGIAAGRLYATVTGRDILPLQRESNVAGSDNPLLAVSAVSIEGGAAIAGSRCTIRLTAANRGASAAEDVAATVTSQSELIRVISGNVNFGGIAAGAEAAGQAAVILEIAPGAPDKFHPPLSIEFQYRNGSNNGGLDIEIDAPRLSALKVSRELPIDREFNFAPYVANTGGAPTVRDSVELITLDWMLEAVISKARYNSIAVGDTGSPFGANVFRLKARPGVVPGTISHIGLVFHSEAGVIDTVEMAMPMGVRRASLPDGPDAYGYVCLDRGDTIGWEGPRSEPWTEINPNAREPYLEGIALNVELRNEDGGAEVIELPFPFRFYGRSYNQITVATAGFIDVGNQEGNFNYGNTPMDLAMGGAWGMIAPFWDHFTGTGTVRGSHVYTAYDETEGVFIVEWSGLRLFRNDTSEGPATEFMVKLYDPQRYPTFSGDSPIRFDYKTISHFVGDYAGDIPYASIGLSSPDGKTGISVGYGGRGTTATPPVSNGSALLFVTAPTPDVGDAGGVRFVVRDPATNAPIPGASLQVAPYNLTPIDRDSSDAEGRGSIGRVPPGRYRTTIWKRGFNRIIRDIAIRANETLDLNIDLTHPTLDAYPGRITDSLRTEFQIRRPINIINNGNGPLNYVVTVLGDSVVGLWDLAEGVVPAGERRPFVFLLNTFGRSNRTHRHIVQIRDTEAGLTLDIPWDVNVDPANDAGDSPAAPLEWALSEAFPNPFNGTTRFTISVKSAGYVSLKLIDATGREALDIVSEELPAGLRSVAVDASSLPQGIYFAKMEAEDFVQLRKVVLLK